MKKAFRVEFSDGKARKGFLRTAHGDIDTPFYMPVATKGSVKYCLPAELDSMGYRCIISNALVYYFYLQDKFPHDKGLHAYCAWPHSITTDSGGFQLLSQSFLVRTTKEGALVKNPFNGKKELVTAEKLIKIQETLGSDIAMVLDDVIGYSRTHKEYFDAMVKTHEWARVQAKERTRKDQLLFGIAQGGFYKDLREHSARYISSLDFDGIAIGGVAIGEPFSTFMEMVSHTIDHLPEDKPRYLLGVGNPTDIIQSIEMGVDMFDSTFPTKNARHGTLFTKEGKIRITNTAYKKDTEPIEKDCDCYACRNFTRSFLHYGIKTREPNVLHLCTIHNLSFMSRLMREARNAIESKRFKSFSKEFLERFT